MDFNKLREKHKQLSYGGFEILQEDGNLKIVFNFLLTPDIKFQPVVILPNVSRERLDKIDPKVLENLVFNLGMVELLSYWKAACPPEIIIKAGYLNEEQIKFWKNLLIKGLGEFFYTNKIDFTKEDLVNFAILRPEAEESLTNVSPASPTRGLASSKRRVGDSSLIPTNSIRAGSSMENTIGITRNDMVLADRDLVLVGGGKDSAVTLELVNQEGRDFGCLLLNPTDAALKIAEAGGCKSLVMIKRIIDPKLLELNEQGYLNGHTPFSAYLAFLSVLAGVVYDYKNLVVSNESSSDEGNVTWLGQEINHQYSKTSEFEQAFKDYSKKYLAISANYYSFLRPFGELEITEKFAKMEKYHKLFRSCNKGSKEGIWCGKCPKCVSTYLLLYPFLGKKTATIFGKDLLEDENLIPVVCGLLRENDEVKPFECVATVTEIKTAISLGVERSKKEGLEIPKVLEAVKQKVLNFELARNQAVLILGFGREGKSVLEYFKKHFPHLEVGIADKKDGANYLEKLKDYDVIIKSPGIPYLSEIIAVQSQGKTISSATKIFFDNFKGKIIGVTGTKGKSTTASLIYHVLKNNGLDAHLIGNIGKPALELLDGLNENSIVVYELSSFQLEGLDKSPQVAVMTNIYPEHLDHHGDFASYIKAKSNITKYQTNQDYLIYNQDVSELKEIASISQVQKLPYSKKDISMVQDLVHNNSLLGEHNLLNIVPSILIGRLFNIADGKIAKAISTFQPLAHRLEFVGEFQGIKFYNDSLATIPQATVEALKALGEDVETLIAGGFDRGVDYAALGEAITKSDIKTLILFPDTGEKILRVVQSLKFRVQSFNTDNMKEAVELAFKHTGPGKIVLLSPAASSFNLFKDYADRGDQFKEAVKNYSPIL